MYLFSANKIHISESTNSALKRVGGFRTKFRGNLNIKVSVLYYANNTTPLFIVLPLFLNILRQKSLAICYSGFSHKRSFYHQFFLSAGAQTPQLFENDQMATCKRSKETNSNFIARV